MLPKEHGSWSLALEPLALGLLAVPSVPGLWLALAAFAGFLARRPLRLARRETDVARRHAAVQALAILAGVALGALIVAFMLAPVNLIGWLVAPALAGAVFLVFDLQNDGREGAAEIAGATAFAAFTGTIAAAGGWTFVGAGALLFAMCGRAIPTVMAVRSYVRSTKTGRLQPLPALVAATLAAATAMVLSWRGLLPLVVPIALTLLWLRTWVLLVFPRPRIRARTLGFQELGWGVAYVVSVALLWSM